MIKLILTLCVAVLSGLSLQAQTAEESQKTNDNLPELASTSKYIADKNSASIDELGRVSSKIKSYYDNGSIEEMGALLNDKKNGTWTKYNEKGVLINKAEYIAGVKDGDWKVWDDFGTLRLDFEYEDGKRVGVWKMYDADGKEINSQTY